MKEWSYSSLSKTVSAYGGPEAFVKFITEKNYASGRNQGHLDMMPSLAMTTGLCVVSISALVVGMIKNYYTKRRSRLEDKCKESEQLLLECLQNAQNKEGSYQDIEDVTDGQKRLTQNVTIDK